MDEHDHVVTFVESVAHVFPLRRDLMLRIDLPMDLTAADVERLARWLRTLVFEPETKRAFVPAGVHPAAVRSYSEESEAPSSPALPPALPAATSEPEAPAAPTAPRAPAIVHRVQPRIFIAAGGGQSLIDLWGTILARRGTSAADAARVVAMDGVDPWELLEPLAGVAVNAGAFGGTVADNGAIVSAKSRADAVIITDQAVRGVHMDNDPSKERATLYETAVKPIEVQAFAPAAKRIYRIAWACPTQKLTLSNAEKLPAKVAPFRLAPTVQVPELQFYWAMWVGP